MNTWYSSLQSPGGTPSGLIVLWAWCPLGSFHQLSTCCDNYSHFPWRTTAPHQSASTAGDSPSSTVGCCNGLMSCLDVSSICSSAWTWHSPGCSTPWYQSSSVCMLCHTSSRRAVGTLLTHPQWSGVENLLRIIGGSMNSCCWHSTCPASYSPSHVLAESTQTVWSPWSPCGVRPHGSQYGRWSVMSCGVCTSLGRED